MSRFTVTETTVPDAHLVFSITMTVRTLIPTTIWAVGRPVVPGAQSSVHILNNIYYTRVRGRANAKTDLSIHKKVLDKPMKRDHGVIAVHCASIGITNKHKHAGFVDASF